MKMMCRYEVFVMVGNSVMMQERAKIRHFDKVGDRFFVWAEVDTEKCGTVLRVIDVIGDGFMISSEASRYIGTVKMDNLDFGEGAVLHAFSD